MKTLKLITISIFTLFLFNSCDEIEDLAKIDIDHTHTETFTVQTSDVDGSFEGSFLVDLSENTEIDKYIDKIDKVVINSIKYKIVEFPEDLDVSGTINILAAGKTFAFMHGSLLDDFTNGVVSSVNDVAGLSVVANQLLATKKVDIAVSGIVNNSESVTMKIEAIFDITVTTKPI